MKPEIKQKWVEALRSGNYLQCEDRLSTGIDTETGKRMCCVLGVLHDISALGEWTDDGDYLIRNWQTFDPDEWDRAHPNEDPPDESEYDNMPADMFIVADTETHHDVQMWSGLPSGNPRVKYGGLDGRDKMHRRPSLSELNDDADLTFSEIADVIEAEL